ncbi:MAG: ABC transporter substrate-binding protein [Armatimonadota bacterium]|nr:ABC transporter substrate-binding protein [Armatimonadota bacterium]MDR7563804.1 ABC transporter substrate-binding protein [Armatimonadota bacterium]MDR7600886.1 ABC transporter substrate-binding protein [Armatimonadota bacterium]
MGIRRVNLRCLWIPVVGLLLGCQGAQGPVGVEVACLLPLTSGVAEAALSAQRGVQLAVEEVNAEGRIRMELRISDDRGSFERAGALFTEAVASPRIAAVIGGFTDTVAIALSPAAVRAQVPLISPGATGEIPFAGNFFFRTALPAALQGQALAAFARRSGLRRVTVLHDTTEYGASVANSFVEAFLGPGGGSVTGQRRFQDGTRDFRSLLQAIRSENVQAVLFAGYPDEGKVFLAQTVETGLRFVVLSPDAFANPEVVTALGKNAEGLVVTSAFFPESTIPAVRSFVRAYRGKYGVNPDAFAAQAYDAVKVLAFAIKQVRIPPTGPLDRSRIRNALANVQDYPGVTGTLRFDRSGTAAREAMVLRVEGSRFVVAP